MSKYAAKATLRSVKNFSLGFSDIQVKVREATSNDPWGPSGTQMSELADASYNPADFADMMEIIDKRLNDSGKNWRHVFKSLTLLDYMIHAGSEEVVAYAKQNMYIINTLKEFQYIDEAGKDQGANVREKSKSIVGLLNDEVRLKEEREKRSALRSRMMTGSSVTNNISSVPSRSNYRPGSGAHIEEERQMQRAIEESKRSAEEHERRLKAKEQEERDLQKAIELSRSHPQPQPNVDIWGSTTHQEQKNDFDFFASAPAAAPAQVPAPSDPFGFGGMPSSSTGFQAANNASFQSFQSNSNTFNPFGATQQQQQPAQQQIFGGGFQSAQPAMYQPPQQLATSQSAPNPFAIAPQQQNQLANSTGNNFQFGSAFDTNAGQKSYIPRHLQGDNPNAQLAQIARNATQIDPFANMASSGNSGSFGNNLNQSNSSMNQFGNNNQAKSSFGDLNGSFGTLTPSQANQNPFAASNMMKPMQPTSTASTARQQPSASSQQADPFASLVAPLTSSKPSTATAQNPITLASLTPQSGSSVMRPSGSANAFGQPMQAQQTFGAPSAQSQNNFFF